MTPALRSYRHGAARQIADLLGIGRVGVQQHARAVHVVRRADDSVSARSSEIAPAGNNRSRRPLKHPPGNRAKPRPGPAAAPNQDPREPVSDPNDCSRQKQWAPDSLGETGARTFFRRDGRVESASEDDAFRVPAEAVALLGDVRLNARRVRSALRISPAQSSSTKRTDAGTPTLCGREVEAMAQALGCSRAARAQFRHEP